MDSIADDVGNPDFDSIPWGVFGRNLTLGCVSLFGKFILTVLNTTTIINGTSYTDAVLNREKNIGLITVSNHTSTLDDPTLHGVLLPAWFFFTEHRHQGTRWVGCAEEICFKNEFLRQFFITGKTLPVRRGGGVHQPVMSKLGELVRQGNWVHVFPEGKISYTGRLGELKWGVGKIICDATDTDGRSPIVVPFYHSGMGNVLPRRAVLPRVRQGVTITIGTAIDLRHLTCHCHKAGEQFRTWAAITHEIEKALKQLEIISPRNRT